MRSFLAILVLLALTAAPALAAPTRACLTQNEAAKEYRGKYLKYRQVGSVRCWFAGRTPDKSEFKIVRRAPPTPKAGYASAASASAVQASVAQASVAPQPRRAPTAPDDLAGLAGTLCAG